MCETNGANDAKEIQYEAKKLALIDDVRWEEKTGWGTLNQEQKFLAQALQLDDKVEGILQEVNEAYQAERSKKPKLKPGSLLTGWQETLVQKMAQSIRNTNDLPDSVQAVNLAEAVALCCVMKGLNKRQMKELHANVETTVAKILYRNDTPTDQLAFLTPRLYRTATRHPALKPCQAALTAYLRLLENRGYDEQDIKPFAQFVQAIREFFEFYVDVKPKRGGS